MNPLAQLRSRGRRRGAKRRLGRVNLIIWPPARVGLIERRCRRLPGPGPGPDPGPRQTRPDQAGPHRTALDRCSRAENDVARPVTGGRAGRFKTRRRSRPEAAARAAGRAARAGANLPLPPAKLAARCAPNSKLQLGVLFPFGAPAAGSICLPPAPSLVTWRRRWCRPMRKQC